MLTASRRTTSFLGLVRCCKFLRTTKPWLKWSWKAEVQQWDMYPEPTELLLIRCLTELIWIPRFKSSMSTKYTICGHTDKRKFHTLWVETLFFICLTSAISAYFAALRIQTWPAAWQRWRKGCKNRKENRGSWQSQSRRRWTWPSLLFDCAVCGCVEKPRDTQSTLSNRLVQYRETWRKRTQSRPRVAKRYSSGCRDEETRRDRRRPGTPELSWRVSKDEETRRFRKLRNRRQWQRWTTQSPKINKIMCCFVYSFVKPHLCHPHLRVTSIQHLPINVCHQKKQSPMDQMKDLDVNTALWRRFMSVTLQAAVHLGKRLHRKYAINQESTPRHFGDSYFRCLKGWSLIRQKLLDWQQSIGSSLCGERRLCWLTELFSLQLPKPTTFLTQCSVWVVSVLNQSKHEKATLSRFFLGGKHVVSKIWIESTENKRKSSGKISEDSLHWEFSTRFKRWWLNQSVNRSNSKEGSSSCECAMTLIGRLYYECTQSYWVCSKIHARTLVISRAWMRRNGLELFSTNLMENVTNCWRHDAQLCWKRTSYVPCDHCFGKRRMKSKGKVWNPSTSTVVMTRLNWFFEQSFPSINSEWWYRQNFFLLTQVLRLIPK